jgi:hypothetical protein
VGWDFVTYGDRAEMLHDLQLWALRHFLMGAAASLAAERLDGGSYAEARAFFAAWDWPGPGVVTGTRLDEFVRARPERVRALAHVLERAAVRVRRFGRLVPLEYLAAHVNAGSPGGVFTGPQSSRSFVRALSRIRGMLGSMILGGQENVIGA